MNKIIQTFALIFVFTIVAACKPVVIEEPDDENVFSCEKWNPEIAHPDDSYQDLYDKLSRSTAMQRLCE